MTQYNFDNIIDRHGTSAVKIDRLDAVFDEGLLAGHAEADEVDEPHRRDEAHGAEHGMGGKSVTVLSPCFSRPLKATELLRPMVCMKKATETV